MAERVVTNPLSTQPRRTAPPPPARRQPADLSRSRIAPAPGATFPPGTGPVQRDVAAPVVAQAVAHDAGADYRPMEEVGVHQPAVHADEDQKVGDPDAFAAQIQGAVAGDYTVDGQPHAANVRFTTADWQIDIDTRTLQTNGEAQALLAELDLVRQGQRPSAKLEAIAK